VGLRGRGFYGRVSNVGWWKLGSTVRWETKISGETQRNENWAAIFPHYDRRQKLAEEKKIGQRPDWTGPKSLDLDHTKREKQAAQQDTKNYFLIAIYNRFTEVTALPPSFHYWNRKFVFGSLLI
jgi:hypothetical protein